MLRVYCPKIHAVTVRSYPMQNKRDDSSLAQRAVHKYKYEHFDNEGFDKITDIKSVSS